MTNKMALRKRLRAERQRHARAVPTNMHGLIFRHPPVALLDLIPPRAAIGLYHATADEVPPANFAKFFSEAGHTIALPRFSSPSSDMEFAEHTDPFGETDLTKGPFGVQQPIAGAAYVTPDIVFAPLVGFTEKGVRLGQGGGHYDAWLAKNPGVNAIGLAWDCQLADDIPAEPHDVPLTAVVTPTRLYGPF